MNLSKGQRVHYQKDLMKPENGIVKSVVENGEAAFVVFHCAGEWDNYENYTGQYTRSVNLKDGWVDEKEEINNE